MTPRVRAVLEARWETAGRLGMACRNRSGHVEPSSLRKLHAKGFETMAGEAAKRNESRLVLSCPTPCGTLFRPGWDSPAAMCGRWRGSLGTLPLQSRPATLTVRRTLF